MAGNIVIKQVLLKRGNTSAASSYIGPIGEVIVDTGLQSLRVQNGVTPGGWPIGGNLFPITSNITILQGNIAVLQSNAASQQVAINSLQSQFGGLDYTKIRNGSKELSVGTDGVINFPIVSSTTQSRIQSSGNIQLSTNSSTYTFTNANTIILPGGSQINTTNGVSVSTPGSSAYGINENPTSNNVFWSYTPQDTATSAVEVGWTAQVVGIGTYTVTNVSPNTPYSPFIAFTLSDPSLTLPYRCSINFSSPAKTWLFDKGGNLSLPTTANTGIKFNDGSLQKTAWSGNTSALINNGKIVNLSSNGVLTLTDAVQTYGDFYFNGTGSDPWGSMNFAWSNGSVQTGINMNRWGININASNAPVYLVAGSKAWQLDSTGNVTFPDNTKQSTAYLGAANGSNQYLGTGDSVSFNNASITGNLIVSGTTTTISANNLIVNDNIIYMASGNSGNILDIGFAGHFTSDKYQHTGFVRQASTGQWKLFSNVTAEPGNTIDFTNAVYDSLQTGNITTPGITVTASSGTAPFVISSTTRVDNLNVDQLDGQHGSYYLNSSNHTNKPIFVQPTAPTPTGSPYLWIQTGLGPSGTDFTFWIEDGQ